MKLIILPTADEVSTWAAKYVIKKINDFKTSENNYFVLGLPTGEYSNAFTQVCYFIRYSDFFRTLCFLTSWKAIEFMGNNTRQHRSEVAHDFDIMTIALLFVLQVVLR